MDYAHIYPDATIRYKTSDMQLHVDSDATYLILPKVQRRGADHFYLSNYSPPKMAILRPPHNEPILIECVTLCNVTTSTAEAEIITLHRNGKAAFSIHITLKEPTVVTALFICNQIIILHRFSSPSPSAEKRSKN